MNPEKQKAILEISEEIGEFLGKLIGGLTVIAILSGLIYAILALMIGLSVTYIQVFGAVLLIKYIKYLIQN
jgi:hypothetical protein